MKKNNVKATITTAPYYFGSHTWTLELTKDGQTKSYYLGQDGKVVTRLLGLTINRFSNLIRNHAKLGVNAPIDFRKQKVRDAVGALIVKSLGIADFPENSWDLAAD